MSGKTKATALLIVSSPSEMMPLIGTFKGSRSRLTSWSNAVISPCVLLSNGRAKRIGSREAVAHDPEYLVPHIRLQAIQGQDHTSLFLQPGLNPLSIGEAQGHE